jgi:hypothetical protein
LDETDNGQREREIGTDDMLGLRLLDCKWLGIKAIPGKDPKAYCLFAHGLVFSIDLDLQGPWLGGHLRNLGFGLIRKDWQ